MLTVKQICSNFCEHQLSFADMAAQFKKIKN